MPADPPAKAEAQVDFTPEFKRNVRQLAKKYRRIKSDLQPVIDSLGKGVTPGDPISRTGEEYALFKARIRNSDSGKGKSGGYRLIYWVKSELSVILITIYSKTEQGDVSAQYLRQVIAEHGLGEAP